VENLQTFNLPTELISGKNIRIVMKDNEPWFVARDIADVLEIKNISDAISDFDGDEKADVGLTYTSSNGVTQSRSTSIISESGFYYLVMRSRKPIAKPFQKWVTKDVLVKIRKDGFYIDKKAVKSDDVKIFKLLNETEEVRNSFTSHHKAFAQLLSNATNFKENNGAKIIAYGVDVLYYGVTNSVARKLIIDRSKVDDINFGLISFKDEIPTLNEAKRGVNFLSPFELKLVNELFFSTVSQIKIKALKTGGYTVQDIFSFMSLLLGSHDFDKLQSNEWLTRFPKRKKAEKIVKKKYEEYKNNRPLGGLFGITL
jgi:prophage antirepressor-like protein